MRDKSIILWAESVGIQSLFPLVSCR